MSYDQTASARQQSRFERWAEDWISDWFGLFDIAIGIITLTAYYPTTQAWWFKKCGRVGDDPIQPNDGREVRGASPRNLHGLVGDSE